MGDGWSASAETVCSAEGDSGLFSWVCGLRAGCAARDMGVCMTRVCM
ncbi:hypothetical protein ANCCAN_28222, partial [Ancylostoma caninum]